jgi:hypothetical protein
MRKRSREITFYSDENGVTVTSARLIISQKTYAMANITSVSVAKLPPPVGRVFIFGIGFLLGSYFIARQLAGIAKLLIIGIALTVLAVFVNKFLKPTYTVRVGSASGEWDIISSKDREYIEDIVDAINEAIIERG